MTKNKSSWFITLYFIPINISNTGRFCYKLHWNQWLQLTGTSLHRCSWSYFVFFWEGWHMRQNICINYNPSVWTLGRRNRTWYVVWFSVSSKQPQPVNFPESEPFEYPSPFMTFMTSIFNIFQCCHLDQHFEKHTNRILNTSYRGHEITHLRGIKQCKCFEWFWGISLIIGNYRCQCFGLVI